MVPLNYHCPSLFWLTKIIDSLLQHLMFQLERFTESSFKFSNQHERKLFSCRKLGESGHATCLCQNGSWFRISKRKTEGDGKHTNSLNKREWQVMWSQKSMVFIFWKKWSAEVWQLELDIGLFMLVWFVSLSVSELC